MNLASVESIKSYFDLANMTEEELQEKISNVKKSLEKNDDL